MNAHLQIRSNVRPASLSGVGAGLMLLLATSTSWAAPTVSSVGGNATHKGTLTVQGSGFGVKAQAAPTVWDDCSGSSPAAKWDFVYPDSNDAAYRLTYRAPNEVTTASGGGVPLPHSHITRYLAGAHYNSGSANAHSGYDVCAGKNNQEGKAFTYISYYRRIDPKWTFINDSADTSQNDHNFKEYDWAAGSGYMGSGPNLYFGASFQALPSAEVSWGGNYVEGMGATITGANAAIVNWYPSTGGVFPKVAYSSPRTGWQKVELVLKHRSADGFHRIYENNKLVWDVSVNDDTIAAGARAETVIGGYAREYGSTTAFRNNWRYYADVYYDRSLARVVLANSATYANATIVEPQIPTAWADGQVVVTVNQGALPDNTTVYAFVFDETGARSTTGAPVQLGSSTSPPPPPADAGAGSSGGSDGGLSSNDGGTSSVDAGTSGGSSGDAGSSGGRRKRHPWHTLAGETDTDTSSEASSPSEASSDTPASNDAAPGDDAGGCRVSRTGESPAVPGMLFLAVALVARARLGQRRERAKILRK